MSARDAGGDHSFVPEIRSPYAVVVRCLFFMPDLLDYSMYICMLAELGNRPPIFFECASSWLSRVTDRQDFSSVRLVG